MAWGRREHDCPSLLRLGEGGSVAIPSCDGSGQEGNVAVPRYNNLGNEGTWLSLMTRAWGRRERSRPSFPELGEGGNVAVPRYDFLVNGGSLSSASSGHRQTDPPLRVR